MNKAICEPVKPGSRVYAVQKINRDTREVFLFGFGRLADSDVPDIEAGGIASMVRKENVPNPKIILDNKDVVWGCECWWAGEESFVNFADFKITPVSLADFRLQSKEN